MKCLLVEATHSWLVLFEVQADVMASVACSCTATANPFQGAGPAFVLLWCGGRIRMCVVVRRRETKCGTNAWWYYVLRSSTRSIRTQITYSTECTRTQTHTSDVHVHTYEHRQKQQLSWLVLAPLTSTLCRG